MKRAKATSALQISAVNALLIQTAQNGSTATPQRRNATWMAAAAKTQLTALPASTATRTTTAKLAAGAEAEAAEGAMKMNAP